MSLNPNYSGDCRLIFWPLREVDLFLTDELGGERVTSGNGGGVGPGGNARRQRGGGGWEGVSRWISGCRKFLTSFLLVKLLGADTIWQRWGVGVRSGQVNFWVL